MRAMAENDRYIIIIQTTIENEAMTENDRNIFYYKKQK